MISLSKQNATHDVYIFPEEYLPSKSLTGVSIRDKETGELKKANCICVIQKYEPFPSGWLFILTGKYFDEKLWDKYPKSEKIFVVSVDN